MGPQGGPTGPRPKMMLAPQIVLILSLVNWGGQLLSNVGRSMDSGAIAGLGGLLGLAGLAVAVITIINIHNLGKYTNDPNFVWWHCFIPCYNIYWWFTTLRDQVRKARQMSGLNPELKSAVIYFFLAGWGLASDMADFSEK